MSRSKEAVELCALLVDETYGELTSRIFTILLRRGRLPIPLLSKHTGLTSRQLRHGLAVLIQQNLVFHDVDPDTDFTHYEANQSAAYGLIRAGKIIELVEARHGATARDVVQNLFLLGHTQISDLVEAYESKPNHHANGNGNGQPLTNGVNGHHKAHSTTAGQLHGILHQLLEGGIIEPVVEDMFRSPSDMYNRVEKQITKDDFGGSTKGAKQKVELEHKVRQKLQEARSVSQKWAGKKRPLNGNLANGNSAKRRKIMNGEAVHEHSYEDDSERLDPNLVIRINFEKCTVILRNKRLVELAKDRIGETTAQIYAEFLRLLEQQIHTCRRDMIIDDPLSVDPDDIQDAWKAISVTTQELAVTVVESVNVAKGIGTAPEEKTDRRLLKKSRELNGHRMDGAEVEGDATPDEDEPEDVPVVNGHSNIPQVVDHGDPFREEDDDIVARPAKRPKVTFQDKPPRSEIPQSKELHLMQVKNHLLLLAAEEIPFLSNAGGSRGGGEWAVDFKRIVDDLQNAEIDKMIFERFGKHGHRLVRMMRQFGKLDEKQLPTLALMKQKDIRTKLAEMQMAGVIDICEIARDAGHATNRTMFYWYFDRKRVSAILIDSIYKMMSRCFQRLEIEKRKAHDVLECTERSDVRDLDPVEYLEPPQLEQLRDIRAKEECILGQLNRLDELIGIFRDY